MKLLDVDAAVRNDDMREQQPEAVICEDAFKDRFWPEAVVSRIAGLERSGGAEQDRHSALSV